MKISDSLGNLYTHTMFKKKNNYDMKDDAEEISVAVPSKRHHHHHHHSKEPEDLEDDLDDESVTSDRSEDSISTKSSRVMHSKQRRGVSEASRGRVGHDHDQRDREDAISFASRRSLGPKIPQPGGTVPRHALTASMRSKQSTTSKKYPPEGVPVGGSYSLWSAQNSLRRDHKRKFNRSLCGVLLGISIVLVILGILGIIGIAVYLGVAQKLEAGADLYSIDGAIRVISDDFSISLLNPDSELYHYKATKYAKMISSSYEKSYISKAFVRASIDGFSSGSLRVFFKVILDKRFLPPRVKENTVNHVREILVQEIMSLDNSEFAKEAIDMDSISFAESAVQQEPVQFNTPEPYKQDEESANSDNFIHDNDKPPEEIKSTLWQTLNERTSTTSIKPPKKPPQKIATERIDLDYENDINYYIQQSPDVFLPNLVPSIPDPKNAQIRMTSQLTPDGGSHFMQIPGPRSSEKMMSPFLEAPAPIQNHPQVTMIPQVQWANPNGFIPSVMAPVTPNNNIMADKVSLVVTPMAKRPNIIPMHPSQALRTTPKPPKKIKMEAEIDNKFTAQQIIKQQQINQLASTRKADQEDQAVSGSSDQFWLTLQNRGKANLEKLKEGELKLKDARFFDALADINNNQQILTPSSPKLQFDQITPSENMEERIMSGSPKVQNQFMLQEQLRQKQIEKMHEQRDDSIQVFNPGSSGLQVVEGAVPMEDDQMFSVGGSLVVGGSSESPSSTKSVTPVSATITFQPEVGVYPEGDDPNIIQMQQVQAGLHLPQGPLGPMIPKPKPTNFPLLQTPLAPQIPSNPYEGQQFTPMTRNVGSVQVQPSHQLPGPGNYNPPIENTPGQLPGHPGSGQQLIKHYLIHAKEKQQQQKQLSDEMLRQRILNQNMNTMMNQNMNTQNMEHYVEQTRPQMSNSVLQHRNSQPIPERRQDLLTDVLPSAAVGALASGLTPISIFSNLLNAYATLDSKHDITGKLVKQATDFFNPSPKEEALQEEPMEPKDTSTEGQQVPFDAIVVDADDTQPPVRSNVDPGQPLRPKPPSDGVFRVTPSPQFQSHGHYGVQNPNFYSESFHTPTTEGYGPDDFIVETVKLDKDFFHQLFSSKPTLLSPKPEDQWPRKRSRKTESSSELVIPDVTLRRENLDDDISKLQQEETASPELEFEEGAKYRVGEELDWIKSDEVKGSYNSDDISQLQQMALNFENQADSTTTATITTTTTLATTAHKTSDVPKIINSVKTFMRYSIPTEVKISHSLNAE